MEPQTVLLQGPLARWPHKARIAVDVVALRNLNNCMLLYFNTVVSNTTSREL